MVGGFKIVGAIAIYKGEELFFSGIHYILLKLIIQEGSINSAAKHKGIPYNQAWNLIDKLNKISPVPIVVRQKGGVSGGGCQVSEYGRDLVKIFENKLYSFDKTVMDLNEDLDACIM